MIDVEPSIVLLTIVIVIVALFIGVFIEEKVRQEKNLDPYINKKTRVDNSDLDGLLEKAKRNGKEN